MLFRSIFKDKKEKFDFEFSGCSTTLSEHSKNLNFEFECKTSSKGKIKLVGQIPTAYIARWGQIGSESEDEYFLNVFNQNPLILQNIVAELYFENPGSFNQHQSGATLVKVTEKALETRGIHVD